jgi:hypothetical protein
MVEDLVKWFNAGNIVAGLIQLSQDMDKGMVLDDVLPAYLRNYALFQGAVAVLGPLWAVLRLRAIALNETAEPAKRRRRPFRLWRRVRLGEQPMLWKEVFADPRLRIHWIGRIVVMMLVLASFVPAGVIGYLLLDGTIDGISRPRPDPWDAVAENTQFYVVRIAGTCVALLLLMAVAVRAASGISGERDRQTFDGLLTTPLDSDNILFSKWLGAIVSVRRGWLWLGALWGIGALTLGLHPLALLLLVVTWLVYAAFVAALGTWFSVVSRTTMRATVWTLLCTVAAGVGHWLVWLCCVPILIVRAGPTPDVLSWIAKYQGGLTPPFNLGFLASFRAGDFEGLGVASAEQVWEWVGFSVMGTGTWAALAAVLWVATSRRFRHSTGREAIQPERIVQPRPRVVVPATPAGEFAAPATGSPAGGNT